MTFEEAFDLSQHHLWFLAMEKEIAQWDERSVVMAVP